MDRTLVVTLWPGTTRATPAANVDRGGAKIRDACLNPALGTARGTARQSEAARTRGAAPPRLLGNGTRPPGCLPTF